jgi:hypothetical protein
VRVPIPSSPPIEATMTRLLGDGEQLICRVLRLSCGGITALLPRRLSRHLAPNDPYRAVLDLPAGCGPVELIVRPAHRRPARVADQQIIGWRMCGSDDHDVAREKLRGLRRRLMRSMGSAPRGSR